MVWSFDTHIKLNDEPKKTKVILVKNPACNTF